MKSKIIKITGKDLTLQQIVDVSREYAVVKLSEEAKFNISRSRNSVERMIKNNSVVYGLTTGFGSLANVTIEDKDMETLQENLIMSHAVGVGRPLNEDIVRAIMILRINTFANGFSGIRLSTVEKIIEMLNKRIYPFVPEKGSVGSSGDLCPLSHLFLVLLGKGKAFVDGKIVSGSKALKKLKIKSIRLTSKEGLALNNGTPVMTAIAALTIFDSEKLFKNTLISSAMTCESLKVNTSFLDERLHLARPHNGQVRCAKILSWLLQGSCLVNSIKNKVQDAYSLRAIPVVLGASLDAFDYVKEKVLIEINSVTDNPLIFEDKAYSGANFHGQPMALAMDFLCIALSEIGNLSERRIARLVDLNLNEGLPPFLIKNSGLNSGMMIPQYTAAALVSENKVLSHPASVDSIPTCANQEDHVSMGTISARKCKEILDNVTKIIAIEYFVSAQALNLRDLRCSKKSDLVLQEIRKNVLFLDKDRELYPDIQNIISMIKDDNMINKVRFEL